MSPYLKRLLNTLALIGALVFEGTLLLAAMIGLTTTADDAAHLPAWFVWLTGTPWWVPSALLVAIVAYAMWAFRTDQSVANEIKRTQEEAREALRASYDWKAEFLAKEERLLQAVEGLETKFSEFMAALNEQMAEYQRATNADHRKKIAEIEIEKTHMASVHSVEAMIGRAQEGIIEELKDIRVKVDAVSKSVGTTQDWHNRLTIIAGDQKEAAIEMARISALIDRAEAFEAKLADADQRIIELGARLQSPQDTESEKRL